MEHKMTYRRDVKETTKQDTGGKIELPQQKKRKIIPLIEIKQSPHGNGTHARSCMDTPRSHSNGRWGEASSANRFAEEREYGSSTQHGNQRQERRRRVALSTTSRQSHGRPAVDASGLYRRES
jgi:hypothetical protein